MTKSPLPTFKIIFDIEENVETTFEEHSEAHPVRAWKVLDDLAVAQLSDGRFELAFSDKDGYLSESILQFGVTPTADPNLQTSAIQTLMKRAEEISTRNTTQEELEFLQAFKLAMDSGNRWRERHKGNIEKLKYCGLSLVDASRLLKKAVSEGYNPKNDGDLADWLYNRIGEVIDNALGKKHISVF